MTIDTWARLHNFLVLGDESGNYYTNSIDFDVNGLQVVTDCWNQDSARTLEMIVAISTSGKATRDHMCLAALAGGFAHENVEVRRASADALPRVAQTLPQLCMFVNYVLRVRGWGRLLKRAVAEWFQNKPAAELGNQLIKYTPRYTPAGIAWSFSDILRLAHPVPKSKAHDAIYHWLTGGDPYELRSEWFNSLPNRVTATFRLQEIAAGGKNLSEVIRHVSGNQLPWESVPDYLHSQALIWAYLYKILPDSVFLENLPRMGAFSMMSPESLYTIGITARIKGMSDAAPEQLLHAYTRYCRGTLGPAALDPMAWYVNPRVLGALESAFFASLARLTPTGKRIVLAVDRDPLTLRTWVGGASGLSFIEAATVVAGAILREEHKFVVRFDAEARRFPELEISNNLNWYTLQLRSNTSGGRDCSAPIRYCIDSLVDPDAIVILTEAPYWQGQKPEPILNELCSRVGHHVKLVVISTNPDKWQPICVGDPNVMNIAGFDTHTLRLMQEFIATGGHGYNND